MGSQTHMSKGTALVEPAWKASLLAINGRVSTFEQYLLYLTLYVMCLGVLAQWFLRAFFEIGLNWVNEGTTFAMLWAGFLGACLATSRLAHFQIDLVRFIERPRLKRSYAPYLT